MDHIINPNRRVNNDRHRSDLRIMKKDSRLRIMRRIDAGLRIMKRDRSPGLRIMRRSSGHPGLRIMRRSSGQPGLRIMRRQATATGPGLRIMKKNGPGLRIMKGIEPHAITAAAHHDGLIEINKRVMY
jgi:hypothetical protein